MYGIIDRRMNAATPAILLILVLALAGLAVAPAFAQAAGATKIQIRDQTQNGIGPNDPVIGFVVYNQDPNGRLIIEVSLKGAVPNAILTVELVTVGTVTHGGITPEPGGHSGWRNPLGPISTNNQGNGNAHFFVDPTTLGGTVPNALNYGHIDIEGPPLKTNQYGATPLSWKQP